MISVFLRSCVFNIFFFAWTVFIAGMGWPVLFLKRVYTVKLMKMWIQGILWAARVILGLIYEVRGLEHVYQSKSVIVACKHQSTWETLALAYILENPVFVLKKSLLYIPLFGWFLSKLDMIGLRRAKGKKSQIKKFLVQAHQSIVSGRTIVIFPEGTRVKVNQSGAYRSGVGSLYTHFRVPVVPAAVNSGVFWPRRSFLKYPGKIVLEFCSPLSCELDRNQFMHTLQEVIERHSYNLIKEARQDAFLVNKPQV